MKRGDLKIKWKSLFLSFILVYSVALIGSIFTSQGTNSDWYNSIRPSITPPNWVFPIVWNILFFLLAISLYLVIINVKKSMKQKIYIFFGINFILNISWSVFYFFLRNPAIAFVNLIALWVSIISLIYFTSKVNQKSAWLLVPYLLWVSFAGVLNYLSIFA